MRTLLNTVGQALPRVYKNKLKSTAAAFNQLTPVPRAAPDFLIVGAQKAGTSSLYKYLAHHVGYQPPLLKDIYFFDVNYGKGMHWYLSHFPSERSQKKRRRRYGIAAATGEGATYYLFHPWAPERVARHFPEMKIVVLLRDPVKRAISHYHHNVRIGREQASLYDALRLEAERTEEETRRLESDPGYISHAHQHYSYLARGRYARQLRRWFAHFPPEQMLIICSEHFFAEPDVYFRRVCRFVGLPEVSLEHYDAQGQGHYGGRFDGAIQYAVEHFRPHNKELFGLLGERYEWLT